MKVSMNILVFIADNDVANFNIILLLYKRMNN